jgi:hypothetical protein
MTPVGGEPPGIYPAAKIWFAEVPANAQPDVIQTRFAEQIESLEELTGTIPISACDDQPQPTPESARTQMIHVLKAFKPALSFSRSMITPPTTWPAVSLWFIGRDRTVKYEDHVDAGSGEIKAFILTLDLEHL